ncbi:MAG: hypothetical protein ABF976_10415 [Acetobacter syzygii]|uniref:hypothetical protein n=1 Tax=Acetobacter syzygii TaxID=146476 RepID=UPI0039ED7CB3
MSRKERALADLEILYAKIRSDIQNASPDADFSFVSSLIIIEGDKDKENFKSQMQVFGNPSFIIPCAAVALGSAIQNYQTGRTRKQISELVQTCFNVGTGAEKNPWEQTPCSTMKH